MLAEWKKAQEQQPDAGTRLRTSLGVRRWEKPPDGWTKINVDAALFEEVNCIGLGSVARDAEGNFLMARSSRYEELVPPREAEAISLKEALSWANTKNFKKCIFETDSQMLAEACKGPRGNSYFDAIVMDCIDLFQHFDDVLVVFAHRSANGVTHLVARAAHSMSGIREWHENAPDIIQDVLISESV